ncbi:MAG: hypothetical protein SD837_07940 [Candidatus Electrothrix scaldis]|nr:MAG: hypothetical protein SD837_07940 [Candidatus Electrothrix sp. GW3-3]
MKNSTTLKRSLIIAAFVLAATPFTSIFTVSSASAADNDCFKAHGNTAEEAFSAAVDLLNKADKEMGEGWMKDNMQIRLLPDKVNGQFVAIVYSVVHHADACDLGEPNKVVDKKRPNCDKTRCTI